MEKKKIISFVPSYAENGLKEDVKRVEACISRCFNYLNAHAEGMADLKAYIAKGYDYKRRAVIDECRAWLTATNAPTYLHEDALDRAYQSLGEKENRFIDHLPENIALTVQLWNGDILKIEPSDIEVCADGWKPKPQLIERLERLHVRTLTETEMADFGLFEEFSTLSAELHRRGYGFESRVTGEDVLSTYEEEPSETGRVEIMFSLHDTRNDQRVKKVAKNF